MSPARVRAVNVASPRPLHDRGPSAIAKQRVGGRVRAQGVNLDGDDQADRSVHGGPDQALYAYAHEDTVWWEGQLGRSLAPGAFGENLTTDDLDVTGAQVGERWQIGTAVLRVTHPRVPCWKLAVHLDVPDMIGRFRGAGRPGAYLAIDEPGELGATDPIVVVDRPDHGVTIGDLARIYHHDRHEAHQLLAVPQLSASFRAWAQDHAG